MKMLAAIIYCCFSIPASMVGYVAGFLYQEFFGRFRQGRLACESCRIAAVRAVGGTPTTTPEEKLGK